MVRPSAEWMKVYGVTERDLEVAHASTGCGACAPLTYEGERIPVWALSGHLANARKEGRVEAKEESAAICQRWADANREGFPEQALAAESCAHAIREGRKPMAPDPRDEEIARLTRERDEARAEVESWKRCSQHGGDAHAGPCVPAGTCGSKSPINGYSCDRGSP